MHLLHRLSSKLDPLLFHIFYSLSLKQSDCKISIEQAPNKISMQISLRHDKGHRSYFIAVTLQYSRLTTNAQNVRCLQRKASIGADRLLNSVVDEVQGAFISPRCAYLTQVVQIIFKAIHVSRITDRGLRQSSHITDLLAYQVSRLYTKRFVFFCNRK